MPARSAAFASWIARTSSWVTLMFSRGVVGISEKSVRERAPVGEHAVGLRRAVGSDGAVDVDESGEIQLAHHLDDARPADAGDVECGRLHVEQRIVRPQVGPDHLDARIERFAVDPHAFDRARSSAHAGRDLCAFECRPRWARRSEDVIGVAEDDLGIGADVDEELSPVSAVRAFGEDRSGGIGPDVSCDAGEEIRLRESRIEVEVGGPRGDGSIGGKRERGLAQWRWVDA